MQFAIKLVNCIIEMRLRFIQYLLFSVRVPLRYCAVLPPMYFRCSYFDPASKKLLEFLLFIFCIVLLLL